MVLISKYLADGEYEVVLCADSTAVESLFEERFFDLMITDIVMPDIDGIELCRWVKEDNRYKDCPVILTTGFGLEDRLKEAFEAGALDYLVKPIQRQELLVRVSSALKLKSSLDEVHRSHAKLQGAMMKLRHENERAKQALNDLKVVQDVVLFSLSKLAESRDNATGKHLVRTQKYVETIAKTLQKHPDYSKYITNEYIDNLVIAAPLHDIGKVGIPDRILLKPGKLTPEEFEIMKSHTTIGYNTLREAALQIPHRSFLDLATEVAHYHHEKHCGCGYPEGLSGDQIPLSARIMALADIYDALRDKRCYKPSFEHSVAERIIIEEEGERSFHPHILEAFSRNADTFEAISREFQDE